MVLATPLLFNKKYINIQHKYLFIIKICVFSDDIFIIDSDADL